MSSRQARRAQERGHGTTGGPKRRDPMRPIYIGLGVAILLVFVVFAFLNYKTSRDYAAALATPTPGASATPKPIDLHDQSTLGANALKLGDTPSGGTGAPVDGIECQAEMASYHVHAHLALFVNGKQIAIPKFIGFAPNNTGGGCLYWVHTHDAAGIIHVEAPHLQKFTLGNFFDIWGQPLNNSQIATYKGPVTAYVNGNKYVGDLSAIPLSAHQQITLEVGTPVVPPPNYAFPPGE
jgi:hypothetical protein